MTEPHGSTDSYPEPIAIVGVGCRLPGNVSTLEALRAVFQDGRDCVTEVPAERWNLDLFYDPDPLKPGKSYVRHGGFVSQVDRFDAAFFGISDAEAARMDPQQRVVLETVWHALEDAGQSPEELAKSNTGVFLAMMNTNAYTHLKAIYEGLEGTTGYDTMADAMSITAGRISHFLDLQGPCFALDTACSGSMVALHQARQSMLAGDCDNAIVVGVNLILHPGVHVAFSKVGLMSRSGRCRTFDESADGYIRGEGCVAVILRRQSDALARNDRILASILGTALTQDGRTPAVTAPNGQMQEKVIRLALARVGISPSEIGYVEAHGTGTPVGDPIEMSALVNVYGPGRAEGGKLYVGSSKSNFGHTESAAGLLGVVKAALSLDGERIFPSLHFNRLNPTIDLRQAPVEVPTRIIPWPRGERPRIAGINSFGFSGTNAHTILQEAPARRETDGDAALRPSEIVVLSARSAPSLEELAASWTDFLDDGSGASLNDIAFTAATGRSHMRQRLAVVAGSKDELCDKLHSWREGRLPKGVFAGQMPAGRKPKIGFVFTGQGAQYASMGRQLYQYEPRFMAAIDRCAALMDNALGTPLQDVLFGAGAAEFLDNTRFVQPALFAVEYALAELLRSWGVEPNYVIGHSVGEIVAACVAGMITLEGAVQFVLARGRLMGQLPRGGKMLAIEASAEEMGAWLAGKEAEVSLAAVNGPHSVVISGTAAAVDEIARVAAGSGRRGKALEVSHAFHSPLMDPILPELDAAAASLRLTAGTVPLLSNVTGDFLGEAIPASYWSSHVRKPVLFYSGMSKIIEAGCSILIEIGPHPSLTPMIATAFDIRKTRTIPTLMRGRDDVSQSLEALAALFTSGVPVNLGRAFRNPKYRRATLPLYPFRRDKHWLREELGLAAPLDNKPQGPPLHSLFERAVSLGSRRAVFAASIAAKPPWADHRIMGFTVFPAAGYIEMAARGFAASLGAAWLGMKLRNVLFERPLVLNYGKIKQATINLETIARNGSGAESTFRISAEEDGKTEIYCQGRAMAYDVSPERVGLQAALASRGAALPLGQFYGDARNAGFEYGAGFATVREAWLGQPGSGEAVARLAASPAAETPEDHPFRLSTILDGAFQTIRAAAGSLGKVESQATLVPRGIKSVTLAREMPFEVWCQTKVQAGGRNSLIASIRVVDAAGNVIAQFEDLELYPMARLSLASLGQTVEGPKRDLASREELIRRVTSLPAPERVEAVSKWLVDEIKEILGQAAEEINLDELDGSAAFIEIGLDSLLVTELQRRIQEKLEFRFKAMQGLDYQSVDSLARYITDEVLVVESVGGIMSGESKAEIRAALN